MFGTEPDQAEQQISQWAQGFADKAERFGTMRAQMKQIQVTESSADGAVRVTIDSSGAPSTSRSPAKSAVCPRLRSQRW